MTNIVRKDKKTVVGEMMDAKTSGGNSSGKSNKLPAQLAESVVKPFPDRKVKNV
jgi:hypothetical protein